MAKDIRNECPICQAAEPSNENMKCPLRFNSVMNVFMTSVCVDIFDTPAVIWMEQCFDHILICVDLRSGWIFGRPTTKLGLTGQRFARLLLDSSWREIGVPTIITSDLGVQFIGGFWGTICARLGVRQAFSRARRPQANGRTETAGKSVINILRMVHTEYIINWVEALPRVLMIYFDLPHPDLTFFTYQLVFWSARLLAGLPLSIKKTCSAAEEFLLHMENIDFRTARELNAFHNK